MYPMTLRFEHLHQPTLSRRLGMGGPLKEEPRCSVKNSGVLDPSLLRACASATGDRYSCQWSGRRRMTMERIVSELELPGAPIPPWARSHRRPCPPTSAARRFLVRCRRRHTAERTARPAVLRAAWIAPTAAAHLARGRQAHELRPLRSRGSRGVGFRVPAV